MIELIPLVVAVMPSSPLVATLDCAMLKPSLAGPIDGDMKLSLRGGIASARSRSDRLIVPQVARIIVMGVVVAR
jgi:hypothetical protein